MASRTTIELEVIRSAPITEHMLRITLDGEALSTFPFDQESAYLKLLVPQRDGHKSLLRTYTIRYQRPTEIATMEILDTKVGLRSGRHQVRLELDVTSPRKPVVHNDGHGGGGLTVTRMNSLTQHGSRLGEGVRQGQ